MNGADIMTREVVTVRPDTSVSAVAQLLRDNKISSVPAVDAHDHVVGIISEGDLLGSRPCAVREAGGCGSLMTKRFA